jgi:glycosyltransferase involved in cell wall biosynthesis
MKNFYLSSITGMSGICKYSRDFFELVLKPKGYQFIDSSEDTTTIMSAISSRDYVHIEIGIFQKKEIEILLLMLKANYKNVSVTLHDAPLVKYPFHEFKDPLLNGFSKLYDRYINNFSSAIPLVKKIKSIYVLSRKGEEAIKKRYHIDNVYYLPHIINISEITKPSLHNNNLLYFGFIGRNKGIEYALQLHKELINFYPDVNFYVAGTALGKERKYYNFLKLKYNKNVHFLGYVPDEQLSQVFDKASFAIIMFKDYQFFWPFSGSILHSLKKGKIVLTNNVNTVSEVIDDGKNGFFLSGDPKKDIAIISNLFTNKPLLEKVQKEVVEYLINHHSVAQVSNSLGYYQ